MACQFFALYGHAYARDLLLRLRRLGHIFQSEEYPRQQHKESLRCNFNSCRGNRRSPARPETSELAGNILFRRYRLHWILQSSGRWSRVTLSACWA
jgi:hypothetical protein